MKSFATSATIQAAPEAIWRILTDAVGYASWNTTVLRVDGVIAFDAPRRMVWRGGMPLGLFKGERVFELRPATAGGVEFTMREDYSGWLAPLITKSIPDLQPAFDEFAACLKARAQRK